MREEQLDQNENRTKDLKFYSQRSIALATYLGGPLAAAYMIRANFLALKNHVAANRTIWIGLLGTIMVFGGIFLIPEDIIEHVPNVVIPLIYMGVIYLIVEKYQGAELKVHKEFENQFYSGWRAAGIGLISLLIVASVLLSIIFLEPEMPHADFYDKKLALFEVNESESLKFFENAEFKSNLNLINELDNSVIPKWEENVKIIASLNQFDDLPVEIENRNELLLEYSKLRLEVFKLIKKSLIEDSTIYDGQIRSLNVRMNQVLEELNQY